MATTSDLGLLGRKLGAADYDPDMYVKEIAQRCVGGHELHQQRVNIQTLSEDTNSQLKKNVYQNYGQFIETAKEISYLESEMYQLAHMITEQRNLLLELMDSSILGDKALSGFEGSQGGPGSEEASLAAAAEAEKKAKEEKAKTRSEIEEGRRRLYELLEKVEGCSHVTDVPTRYLLHDGDLVEMDVNENTALHRVHGYLMNDGFMVATWLPNRRGPVRFKYSCLYELDSLAVVNVRDFGGIKCAFRLLVFPDARLFQCANAESKSIWMEAFENAKRSRQKQRDEVALRRSDTLRQSLMSTRGSIFSPLRGNATGGGVGGNPFDDVAEEEDEGHFGGGGGLVKGESTESAEDDPELLEMELPEWLQELPDDLEVFIAQREFEEAVDLIDRASAFCNDHSDSALVREAKVKLESKKKSLIEVLTGELRADKSVRGGPRAARKAVQLLVKLDRSSLACQLFLRHRAAILHNAFKSSKIESATVAYVQRLSATFFSNVLESSIEFRRAFPLTSTSNPSAVGGGGKAASFLVWVEEELTKFCSDRIERQVFSSSSTPLETVATCIEIVRTQTLKLRDSAGLDVVYIFDNKFRRNVERCIHEARDKHVEAVKIRGMEDKWAPINCFNKSGTDRFVDEMSSAGIPSIRSLIYDECWVSLTRNTTSFALSYLNLTDSLLKLFNPSTRALVNESLVTVFHSHLRHIEQAVRSERLKDVNPTFVQKNASFLLDTLLSLIEHKYQEKTESECPKLGKLHSSYSWLKDGTEKPAGKSTGDQQPKYSAAQDPNYV